MSGDTSGPAADRRGKSAVQPSDVADRQHLGSSSESDELLLRLHCGAQALTIKEPIASARRGSNLVENPITGVLCPEAARDHRQSGASSLLAPHHFAPVE